MIMADRGACKFSTHNYEVRDGTRYERHQMREEYYVYEKGSKNKKGQKAIEYKKGTKPYWEAIQRNRTTPEYWKVFPSSEDFDHYRNKEIYCRRYEITDAFSTAISDLVQRTWDPEVVKYGKDARKLQHKGIEITKIERVENINLFVDYANKRANIISKMLKDGKTEYDGLAVSTVKGPIRTAESDFLSDYLYSDVNEVFAFHGTKASLIDKITHSGLDPRKASSHKMFGNGIYFAESSTKADQYADTKDDRQSTGLKMLLARLLIGDPYVAEEPYTFKQAPCKDCPDHRKTCIQSTHTDYDSVVGEGDWLHREFVVYSKDECYPEYIITYNRV